MYLGLSRMILSNKEHLFAFTFNRHNVYMRNIAQLRNCRSNINHRGGFHKQHLTMGTDKFNIGKQIGCAILKSFHPLAMNVTSGRVSINHIKYRCRWEPLQRIGTIDIDIGTSQSLKIVGAERTEGSVYFKRSEERRVGKECRSR